MKDKPLIVFYSRTGTTKRVAESISNLLKCDVEEIVEAKDRKGPLGYIKSGFDAMSKKLTMIKEIKYEPSSYDIIIIGTPIWGGTMSTPIRTYISQYKNVFKKVAFFCTGESENGKIFNDMEALCGKEPVQVLSVKPKEVMNGEHLLKIQKFVDAIDES